MSGKCQGILEFQMKFRFSNKKKKRREILKMARAVFFTVWVMLNYSDSFQILLSERKLKGLAPLVSSAAFCSRPWMTLWCVNKAPVNSCNTL